MSGDATVSPSIVPFTGWLSAVAMATEAGTQNVLASWRADAVACVMFPAGALVGTGHDACWKAFGTPRRACPASPQ